MNDTSENQNQKKRHHWPPTLVEWALTNLPPHLDPEGCAQCDRLRLLWEGSRLVALEACPDQDRVQALVMLTRAEWHPDLQAKARDMAEEIGKQLTYPELIVLGDLCLESGQLRIAEQEDLEPIERVRVLLLERDQTLKARDWLAAAAREEGKGPGEAAVLLKKLKALTRRLHNRADEAMALHRLERTFGRRPWTAFSRFSFICLLVLLVLLLVDIFGNLAPETLNTLTWVDTGICVVFLLEFILTLACVPRRMNWFRRHFLTDFLPAIPFALLLPEMAKGVKMVAELDFVRRTLRLSKLLTLGRYIRVVKPIIGGFRLLIFCIRGMDRIVEGMAPILNRQIIFFEYAQEGKQNHSTPVTGIEERVRRSFARLTPTMQRNAAPGLLKNLDRETTRLLEQKTLHGICDGGARNQQKSGPGRMLRAEEVTTILQEVTPEEVELRLLPATIRGLSRLLALFDLPGLRRLPLLRGIVKVSKNASPAERIATAGQAAGRAARKILAGITTWADLSGVVTAPQILDRIATALIRSTQRPAVRLLLFGTLFVIFRLIFSSVPGLTWDNTGITGFLNKFVATPLLVLGGVCLLVLLLARWLKRIAGEASDRLLRNAEARFANLLELMRRRTEAEDREELARRITADQGEDADQLNREVAAAMDQLRQGDTGDDPSWDSIKARRLALLMLDMQDAGFLHRTDTKGVEQFLSHPDIWNLRHKHLKVTKNENRKLNKLDLETGGLFSGSFLWFELATHALALKVARLCGSYNLHLIPKHEWSGASEAEKKRHQDLVSGAAGLEAEPNPHLHYRTSFFHVLHFMSHDKIWLSEVEREYGPAAAERLIVDRRLLIRGLFGTRALNRLPFEKRSFNPLTVYQEHLSSGRFLLLPLKGLKLFGIALWHVGKVAHKAAREILDPRLKRADLVDRKAPFSVARRKLRLMKKPLLLEAITLAARIDPDYLGLSLGGEDLSVNYRWQEDLALAEPIPQEREQLLKIRDRESQRLLYLPDFLAGLADPPAPDSPGEKRLMAAFAMDENNLASLAAAETRSRDWLQAAIANNDVPTGHIPTTGRKMSRKILTRGFASLLAREGQLSRQARRRLGRAFRRNQGDFRQVCFALGCAGEKSPTSKAQSLATEMLQAPDEFLSCRETLHAILGLIIQDLRHHEELIMEVGGYTDDIPEAEAK